jgi:SAM-dependent methyltransferase
MEDRKIAEIRHNKKILVGNKERVWGWTGEAGKLRLQRRCRLINDLISFYKRSTGKKRPRILELGCGTGLFTENFDDKNIISFDIYEDFVRRASERNRKRSRQSIFLVADAETLPFLDESFDIVIGISVLHHLDIDSALKEIRRILKVKGRFIFSEPNMLNPQIFIQKNIGFIKRLLGDSPGETAFFPDRLKDVFFEHSLEAEVSPFDFLHPKTPRFFIPLINAVGLFLEKRPFLRYIAGSLLIEGKRAG